MLLGSIEAGGTKFICAVGDEDYRVIKRTQFPTSDPKKTLDKACKFFLLFFTV